MVHLRVESLAPAANAAAPPADPPPPRPKT